MFRLCEHSPHYGAPLPPAKVYNKRFRSSFSPSVALPSSPSQLDPGLSATLQILLDRSSVARQSVAPTLFRCNARLSLLPAEIHRACSTKAATG